MGHYFDVRANVERLRKTGIADPGEDLERFTSAFKGMGAALRLKKRIRAVDAVGFCDALQKVVVLE